MRWLLFLCIAFSFSLQAKTELTILVGLDKPPYIDLNDSSGYELDLLRLLIKKWVMTQCFYMCLMPESKI